MIQRSHVLTLVAAGAAITGIGTWQAFDYRSHRAAHWEQHASFGRALLDAAEGVVIRECRGGRAHVDELQQALTETAAAFGLDGLTLEDPDGRVLASTGVLPVDVQKPLRFEKVFAPLLPNFGGRGPFRGGGSERAITLPARLLLSIAVPAGPVEARIAEDRLHAILTTAALASAVFLVLGVAVLRARAASLESDLARSAVRLEGLETLRRLGAGLAHETRNPLGAVRGFAERLANGRVPADQVERTARTIVEETDRTVARLDEFLLLSRPAALRRTRVEVRELFDELRTLLEPDLDAAGASIDVSCGGVSLDVDRDQIRRLLMNLVLNAIAAVDRGGRIELICERPSARSGLAARLVVADDGTGVPPELRETLFEPYVTGRADGTGLGLSIARRIAEDHGFTLRHEPRAPRGTRMVLEVPQP